MKVAQLILAHKNPAQVEILVRAILHPDADIFIHLDKKTNIRQFAYLGKIPGVFFIRNRVNVHWATYASVQCTINSIIEIFSLKKKYDTLNVLSGQDMLLRPIDEFHQFIAEHAEYAFMTAYDFDNEWQEGHIRLSRYDIGYYYYNKGRYRINDVLNGIYKRKMPEGMKFYGQSSWFTLPMKHAEFIVDYLQKNKNIQRFFKLTWGADEVTFQTILMNSQYADFVIRDNNLRYIDWSEKKANPKVLTLTDKKDMLGSGAFFARKFDLEKYPDIIDELNAIVQPGFRSV